MLEDRQTKCQNQQEKKKIKISKQVQDQITIISFDISMQTNKIADGKNNKSTTTINHRLSQKTVTNEQ
jgi:hypothetical protein